MSTRPIKATELVETEGDTPVGRIAQMLLWIAPHPEEVKLHISEGYRRVMVEIDVPKDDMGRIIGRSGHTINAVRTILYTSLGEDDQDYDISIPDEDRDRRRRRPRGRRRERGSEES
jgi:predicted RNA-binding protein YlqC (UPF0109 family)